MKGFFEGYYYKHQKGDNVLCIIVGSAGREKFIQVITKDLSWNIPMTGNNLFSEKGVRLDIKTKDISLTGEISYDELTPVKYDIMGPFKYFKMECRHSVISMYHRLRGKVVLNGKEMDFTGGVGYIEKDSGNSFPSSYVWVQANDFTDKCSVMASVADIPFMGINFKGCICVVYYGEKEYRLATYLGVRIVSCTKDEIILKQGKYRLEIRVKEKLKNSLYAPVSGRMTRIIKEDASCEADFAFYENGKRLFDKKSFHTSLNEV